MSRSPAPLSLPMRRPAPLSLRRVFQAVIHALRLRKSRRDLAALNAHLLADIGMTPEQARAEATRKLWDAPETWQERN